MTVAARKLSFNECSATERLATSRDRPAIENTARDYLANLRVQAAVYRSAATHRRIELATFDPLQPAAHDAGTAPA